MNKKTLTAFIITLIACILVLATGLTFVQKNNVERELAVEKDKTKALQNKYTDIYELLDAYTIETFEEKVAADETVYAYIGRPDCGDCSALDPNLYEFIKEHPEIREKLVYVNVRVLRENKEAWTAFKEKYQISGTPAFVKFENKKQVSKSEWTEETGYSISMFEQWCKSEGLI